MTRKAWLPPEKLKSPLLEIVGQWREPTDQQRVGMHKGLALLPLDLPAPLFELGMESGHGFRYVLPTLDISAPLFELGMDSGHMF